jgi:hypothetical protein
MADLDSTDMLSRLKFTLQRPTVDDSITDAQLYELLSNAQRRITQLMATHVPQTQYLAPELLTTADSGATYTFLYYPLGYAEIRESRDGAVLSPVPEWSTDGSGYVMEGQTIRWPGGRSRTFSAGPYARYVRQPGVISASVQPILKPDYAREAVVYDAAAEWALLGGLRDPSPYLLLLQRFLWGDANQPGHTGLIPALKTQMAGVGGRGRIDSRWWIGNGWVA